MKSSENNINESGLKKIAAVASISTALTLTLIKTYAAFVTGSLSVLSSLIDSLSDILASAVTYVAIHYSDKPLNEEHRYGYGKAEAVSALIQAAFIAGSACFILYDGFYRFFNPVVIEETMFGIVIMTLCWVITLALILFQKYIIKRVRSQAINADSGHYTVDLLSNGAVILSLFAVKYFNFIWFDAITAILIAVYLLYNAGVIAWRNSDFDQARDYFKKALEIDSSKIDAKINFELSMQQSQAKGKQNQSNQIQASPEESSPQNLEKAVFEHIKENDQKQWKNSESKQPSDLAEDY